MKQNSEKLMMGKQKRVFDCCNSLSAFHIFIIRFSFFRYSFVVSNKTRIFAWKIR